MFDDAADEMIAERGKAEFAACILEHVLARPSTSRHATWQPLPVRPGKGLGMKVARSPCFSAIDFTMYLKKEWRSAVTSASS